MYLGGVRKVQCPIKNEIFVCCKMGDEGSGFLYVILYNIIATHKMLNYKIQYF